MSEWQSISSAPIDGTEILGWRKDCGVILVRWTCPHAFMTEAEMDRFDIGGDTEFEDGWFCADFLQGCRLDADLAPTQWQPIPPEPS